MKIHTKKMNLKEVELEKVAEITNGFSGADIRASVVESGMFAIREGRDHILQADLLKGVEKMNVQRNKASQGIWPVGCTYQLDIP